MDKCGPTTVQTWTSAWAKARHVLVKNSSVTRPCKPNVVVQCGALGNRNAKCGRAGRANRQRQIKANAEEVVDACGLRIHVALDPETIVDFLEPLNVDGYTHFWRACLHKVSEIYVLTQTFKRPLMQILVFDTTLLVLVYVRVPKNLI